mgnify:CR=1 FL=1
MIVKIKTDDGVLKVNTTNGNIKLEGKYIANFLIDKKSEETITDAFEEMLDAKEWDSDVEKIQRWYYGSYVKAPWCATSLSYFAKEVGLDKVVGKHENCDRMKEHLAKQGLVYLSPQYDKKSTYAPKRGDIVLMSNKHTYNDITHVGVVSSVNQKGEINVLSGNCDNAIKYKTYNYKTGKYIVAFGKM